MSRKEFYTAKIKCKRIKNASDSSETDEEYAKYKPPPIPYSEIKKRIVKIPASNQKKNSIKMASNRKRPQKVEDVNIEWKFFDNKQNEEPIVRKSDESTDYCMKCLISVVSNVLIFIVKEIVNCLLIQF